MKNIYTILSLMLATIAATAQTTETHQADKLYARMEYVEAAEAYLRLKDKDGYVCKQLADSYYNVFNTREAIQWYARAVETPQDAETHYRYAQMLKAEGRYEQANVQMQAFARMAPADQRSITFVQNPNYLPRLRSQGALFTEKLLDINDSKYSSFGGVLIDDNTFYFASSRNTAGKTYGANEQPYLDLYMATYDAEGGFSAPEPVSAVNSKWHDGPAAVTADGNTMYFASESFKGRKQFEKDRENNLKIGQVYLFKTTKAAGKWGSIQALPFNDKRWSTGNPAISKDGKTLYFASNREGSMGDTDIWKVEVKDNNSYGEPVNLGPGVNTEGKENFPYITDDNKLYFASNGRQGFGALDIFEIDLDKGTVARNVGLPVNSPKDDFAFSFNNGSNIGFFSSNRSGIDQMYSAVPVCGVAVTVQVKDAVTAASLAKVKIAVLDENKNVLETLTTGDDGSASYTVDCGKAYTMQATHDGYEGGTFPIGRAKDGRVDVKAELYPLARIVNQKEIVLNTIFFEYDASNITREAAFELDKLVEAMKENDAMVIMVRAHTDSRGDAPYNKRLSERRAKAAVQYVLSKGISRERISGKGLGESEPKEACADCTEVQHAQNRRCEFSIVK